MGMGKSGHVGRKIAATLASTGTPAFFVHPAEASHGDLGMVHARRRGAGHQQQRRERRAGRHPAGAAPPGRHAGGDDRQADSTLARHADIVLSSAVDQEACPLNLAPTASTTAQMALGDALAVALLDARGFREEDFARSHPGGSLGRKLLMHVRDLMRSGEPCRASAPRPLHELLREMTGKGLGFTAVVDADGRPLGIFTDGDLRRLIERGADLRALTLPPT
jgi:arabinose-5-phosphate isomerase